MHIYNHVTYCLVHIYTRVLFFRQQMNFFLVLLYVLTSPDGSLDATNAFYALSLVNLLRYPVALFPFFLNNAMQVGMVFILLVE